MQKRVKSLESQRKPTMTRTPTAKSKPAVFVSFSWLRHDKNAPQKGGVFKSVNLLGEGSWLITEHKIN